MGQLLHDTFIEDVTKKIEEIKLLQKKNDIKAIAIARRDLAQYRVNYYEQFIHDKSDVANKAYVDDYTTALHRLAGMRDLCMDLGIFE